MRLTSNWFVREVSAAKAECISSLSARKSSGEFSWTMRATAGTPSEAEALFKYLWMRERLRPSRQVDVLALDEALASLSEFDPRKARVVELRYFGGLSVEETAGVLGISPETAKRDWKMAKAWLFSELTGENDRPGS